MENDVINFVVYDNTNIDEPISQGQAFTRIPLEPPVVAIGTLITSSQEIKKNLDLPLSSMGMDLGPGYQVIEKVYQGENQLVLKIHLSNTAQQLQEHLMTQPVLLNASLQAARVMLVDTDFHDKPIFWQSETIEYFHANEPEWAVITPNNQQGKWDIQLCTANGRVCVRVTGIHWMNKDGHHVKRADVLSAGEEVMMMSSAYESQMDNLQRLFPNITPPAIARVDTPNGAQ
ncbi:polyketide synthase dehydratase domain-containing protein [Bacillus siamensis]